MTVEEVEEESTVEDSEDEEAVELDAVVGGGTIEELADDVTTVLEPTLDVLVTEVTTSVTLSTLVVTEDTTGELVITALLTVAAALLLVCRWAPPISIDAVESWSVSLYAAPARGATTMCGATDARWLRCR